MKLYRLPFTVFILFLMPSAAHSQMRIPIYDKEDSLKAAQIGEQLITALTSGKRQEEIDSMRKIQAQLYRSALKGYRTVYLPDRHFTPVEDLLAGKVKPENVKLLSVNARTTVNLPPVVYACKNLEQLELVESHIRKIPSRLGRLKKLHTISVYGYKGRGALRFPRNNGINTLRIRGATPEVVPGNFRKFQSLDTLDLQQNQLTRLPAIQKNRNLRQLLLQENEITFDNHAIPVHRTLEHLALQKNRIKALPPSIGNLRSLKKLALNYNSLETLPAEIALLENLQELSLYSNQLKKIPSPVYKLRSLEFMDLYYNQIERVSDSIVNLPKLEILYLASNRIFALTEKLGELPHLRELYLHHNRLSYLPAGIAKCNQLHTLRFNANNMVDIPDWVGELTNLKNIDFSQNRIENTPLFLRNLPALELVSMSENPWQNKNDLHLLTEELQARGVIVNID